MTRRELEQLFSETLRSPAPTVEELERVGNGIVELVASGEGRFLDHIKNRLGQIATSTGETLDVHSFDIEISRRLVADEVGFSNWDDMTAALESPGTPILFKYAIAAMERGDFSALEAMVGGAERFTPQIVEWEEAGFFDDEPETLAEIFSATCMLGHSDATAYLLDKGVDALAGTKTGLNGFHYAASSGRPDVIKLLIERKVPMEARNMYGGTVLDQALWSAVYEHTTDHAAIIESLLAAGAVTEPGTIEWWQNEPVPSDQTKAAVLESLRRHGAQ